MSISSYTTLESIGRVGSAPENEVSTTAYLLSFSTWVNRDNISLSLTCPWDLESACTPCDDVYGSTAVSACFIFSRATGEAVSSYSGSG